MPIPEEVQGAWRCVPTPPGPDCRAEWISCEDCDGEPGPDDKCPTCTGCGGGYICATHDGPEYWAAMRTNTKGQP